MDAGGTLPPVGHSRISDSLLDLPNAPVFEGLRAPHHYSQ